MNPRGGNSAPGAPAAGPPAPGASTPGASTPGAPPFAPATGASPLAPAAGASPFAPDGPERLRRLGWVVVGLLALATWALAHPYLGLFHDAGLYTLQALARLHPGLSGDVFLKDGSQDRFTVFSPIYAQLSRLLGVEPAAAALTLVSQIGLLLAAASLARAVLTVPMTLLAVAALIAIPGHYGAYRTFTCIEPFLTPRMPAEAMVLGSLAAALRGAKPLAIVLVLAALLVHPIMAMAGACALYCLYVGESKPIVALALAIVGLKAVALWAYAMPQGPWGRFDAEWLTLVQTRSPYLFLRYWQLEDWSRAAVSIATLLVGLGVLRNAKARTLAKITVLTHAGGLALTLIACDWLHLVLFTQLQPWRWSWLGTVVAALLLPEILRSLWGGAHVPGDGAGRVGRCVALLLLAAWIFASNAYALTAAVAALTALVGLHRLKAAEARWVFYGSIALAALAVVWRLAWNLQFTEAYYFDPTIPLWLRRAMSFTRDGSVPLALMGLAWWLARGRRVRGGRTIPVAPAAPSPDSSACPLPSATPSVSSPSPPSSACPAPAATPLASSPPPPSSACPAPSATTLASSPSPPSSAYPAPAEVAGTATAPPAASSTSSALPAIQAASSGAPPSTARSVIPAASSTPGAPSTVVGVAERLAPLALLALLAGAACATVAPQTWHAWTRRDFTTAQMERFAGWSRLIPPGADVFWPESPLGVWILLDRPSYLSVIQTSGMVFSRASARELARRADALRAAINPGAFLNWSTTGTGMTLTPQQLRIACGAGAFDFLVTGADRGADTPAHGAAQLPSDLGPPSRELRLYRCQAGSTGAQLAAETRSSDPPMERPAPQ